MDSITITKKQWDAIKVLKDIDRTEIIDAICAKAFDGVEPDFEDWRKEEKTAIFNLMMV